MIPDENLERAVNAYALEPAYKGERTRMAMALAASGAIFLTDESEAQIAEVLSEWDEHEFDVVARKVIAKLEGR